jgi:aminodeoxyfutalosine deaminase
LRGESPRETIDLGEMVLMPGLINAHCHLDYTNMAGHFLPQKVFIDWLKLITVTKAGWNESDYAASWQNGAQMLLRTGTTMVGDIEAVPQLLPAMWQATPLRVFSFFEMIGITSRRPARAILQKAIDKIHSLKASRFRAGLSPHAPYTTLPELLSLTSAAARSQQWRVCTHLSESKLEYEMFTHGEGLMFDWLRRSGRDMSDCGNRSPAQHLERCGLLNDRLLAVHVNYLGNSDAALLGRRKVSVAHCPRSHAYFHQGPFPLRKLARAGVNLCLGTDSLASVLKTRRETIELNMFEEMRVLAHREPGLSPRSIVRMATINGARALGMQDQVGELAPGAFADLIALPLPAAAGDVWEKVLNYSGSVAASMIGGKWVIPNKT